MGGTHSKPCNKVARDIWLWRMRRNIWQSATYIPGIQNTTADKLGRKFQDKTEWQLKPNVFNLSVSISVECWLRCVGRHMDRHIGWASAYKSADTQPIGWSLCRPRVVVQLLADMSIYRLLTFCQYLTATCDCSLRRRHNLTCGLVTSAEQRRYPWSTPCFSEASLYKTNVVNHTKPNQKST